MSVWAQLNITCSLISLIYTSFYFELSVHELSQYPSCATGGCFLGEQVPLDSSLAILLALCTIDRSSKKHGFVYKLIITCCRKCIDEKLLEHGFWPIQSPNQRVQSSSLDKSRLISQVTRELYKDKRLLGYRSSVSDDYWPWYEAALAPFFLIHGQLRSEREWSLNWAR